MWITTPGLASVPPGNCNSAWIGSQSLSRLRSAITRQIDWAGAEMMREDSQVSGILTHPLQRAAFAAGAAGRHAVIFFVALPPALAGGRAPAVAAVSGRREAHAAFAAQMRRRFTWIMRNRFAAAFAACFGRHEAMALVSDQIFA